MVVVEPSPVGNAVVMVVPLPAMGVPERMPNSWAPPSMMMGPDVAVPPFYWACFRASSVAALSK
jgi:hypothetical protein